MNSALLYGLAISETDQDYTSRPEHLDRNTRQLVKSVVLIILIQSVYAIIC
jgi:hypothetical protein